MTDAHTFQDALDYLYSFADYSKKRTYRYSAEVFDLQRVHDLLHVLGDPQDQFASFHIAGTKGKGSVSALIAAALDAAGYRTGLYTSPHLRHFTERIRIGDADIPEQEVADLVFEIRDRAEGITGLTTYEWITALGFLYFARQEVDLAVVEVGLGGRLDATNVLDPMVVVITSLSYDHMHLLGDSLSDIAREKAGIIKPDVPIVLAPQQYEAERVVEDIARELNAPLVRVGKDWLYAPGTHDLHRQNLFIWPDDEQPLMDAYVESGGMEEWVPPRFEIPLLGYHQVINATVAYASLRVARDTKLKVEDEAIREGFRSVHWPGRFQVLSESPTVVIDSAHNRDSALKLRIALDDYFPGQLVTLVFGASTDKDISGMFADLLPRVSRLVVTQAEHPRAADLHSLAVLAHGFALRVETVTPVAKALEHAISIARPGEVVVVAGSIFVAGESLAAWEEIRKKMPLVTTERQ
ncbi:MAG TPA: bifunctional folylpolyglutamate synthase/dihydrofolate synthase [Anaerolineae bacterium]|nr:bifunctional folylpolyglutamate synthase/dihydrofolate synthase [Anaerolineae bacterium]